MSQKCISSPCLLMALAGVAFTAMLYDFSGPRSARGGPTDTAAAPDGLPDMLTFTAVIRDFKGASETGGHPDFESYGHSDASIGLIASALDSEGKPVFADSYGQDGCGNF